MFHTPDYQRNLSLRLSDVLDEIGVNERMVLKRRKAVLLGETIETIALSSGNNISVYRFGSLSEGTTTEGLRSDTDSLLCYHKFHVIQDFADWKPGLTNLLMIQDNTTSPGYCLLQRIRDDVPLPATHVLDEAYVRDASGRVLLKNTLFRVLRSADVVKHGPSWAEKGKIGITDQDIVPAYHCNSWPHEARAWLDRQGIGRWPTADMKRFAVNNGCFVVAVGSKVSQSSELEWRISTSQAERCLMFSLNITQIRCYVLMKMILKSFLDHPGEGHISSFMCKTVLLHCIENTHSNAWKENNLYTCLSCCLHVLYNCLQQENCPHFIIPGNNLMAGQFSPEVKALLLQRMFYLIQSHGQALLEVQIDDLGQRLQIKLNMLCQSAENIPSKKEKCLYVSGGLLINLAREITGSHSHMLYLIQNGPVTTKLHLLKVLACNARSYREGSQLEKKAFSLLAPMVCSTLGTIAASLNIQQNNPVSPEALRWLSAGLNSDVSSGRLKLASVLYSTGHMVDAEIILSDIVRQYGFYSVEPMCSCYNFLFSSVWKTFQAKAYHQNEEAVRNICAFCVKFIQAEIHCVPHELQYEMFRSTRDDLQNINYTDSWMDWAVVDSLPYLYFLQYKIYGNLQRFDDQHQALTNLVITTVTKRNIGHKETALNLLGQCMEQENEPNKALLCYMRSLKIRERNNAAIIHICILLARLVGADHEITQQ